MCLEKLLYLYRIARGGNVFNNTNVFVAFSRNSPKFYGGQSLIDNLFRVKWNDFDSPVQDEFMPGVKVEDDVSRQKLQLNLPIAFNS